MAYKSKQILEHRKEKYCFRNFNLKKCRHYVGNCALGSWTQIILDFSKVGHNIGGTE
jgi:hypothetical protein